MNEKQKRRARQVASRVLREGKSKAVVMAEFFRWSVRRTEPYTEVGVKRLSCIRCGEPASVQWQICSDRNNYRPLCMGCDIKLNRVVLKFMKHPDYKRLVDEYENEKAPTENPQ